MLFQQLFLTGNIAAVALGQHVLSHGLHGLPGDDPAADGSLDGDFKELAGNILLQLLAQTPGPGIGLIPVGNEAQCIHRVAVEHQIHLHKIAGAIARERIVQRRIALGIGLQGVKKIVNNLVEGHLIMQLHQICIQILHILKLAPPILAHGHDIPHVVVGADDGNLYKGLLPMLDGGGIGVIMRVIHRHQRPVRFIHMVDHGGQRCHEIQIEFPLQPLLDDLHMEHAQKAAAEPKA